MPFAVENLKLYQKTVDFADQVLATTEHFPRGYGFLADQLNRASVSITANLAEGNGRFTTPDCKHFFAIARGSILECLPLLELAVRRNLIDADRQGQLRDRLEELGKMISGLIKGLDHRAPWIDSGRLRAKPQPAARRRFGASGSDSAMWIAQPRASAKRSSVSTVGFGSGSFSNRDRFALPIPDRLPISASDRPRR